MENEPTIVVGSCACGASGVQLFKTGTCATCRIRELEDGLAELQGGAFQPLRLERGDIIVYRSDEILNDELREGIQAFLEREIPGHRAIVIDGGGELQVVRPAAGGTV